MSQDDITRDKLARLSDALIEDVMATSDTDILAEVDLAKIERARAILIEAKKSVSQRRLAEVREQLESWQRARSHARRFVDHNSVRENFDKIRRADPGFNQRMTIAARNGREPTDHDKEGLSEDLADLQSLDEQDVQDTLE